MGKRIRNNKKFMRKKQKVIFYLTAVTLIFIVILSIDNFKQKQKDTLLSTTNTQEEQRKFVVCLDAGHGGYDNGCTSYTGIKEKDTVLKITLALGKRLEKQGFKVIYTRTSDDVTWPANEKKDIRERVNISNESKANIFLSIHCNMYKSSRFKGFEIWCKNPNSEEEKLAKEIRDEFSKLKYTDCEGIKYESQKSLGVLRNNNATSVLVELGYVSNKNDDKYVNSIEGQNNLVQALEKAVINYKDSIKKR
ncbi:N-acetylmuramoyl-L-alanine amidase [Clostridium cavendishii DSM 21758]|uniref:N-acetylmuramoyl-L-alanine amidase n=1 Tax=Clostridium cavendishii DSM 21758 TaxID=1121302 RepID=A0A1M6PBV0_9CLOT|nr:N-acetylmuramoyl-L-alanine amidase [Clostridium cavendishii]SHK05423.1 N-acetylmuramoyl-L-alanine amidase [Clostridium cavendishii DSM 21758]